jgi:hypothetical protein
MLGQCTCGINLFWPFSDRKLSLLNWEIELNFIRKEAWSKIHSTTKNLSLLWITKAEGAQLLKWHMSQLRWLTGFRQIRQQLYCRIPVRYTNGGNWMLGVFKIISDGALVHTRHLVVDKAYPQRHRTLQRLKNHGCMYINFSDSMVNLVHTGWILISIA